VEVGSDLIHHLEKLAGDLRDPLTPCVLIESLGTWLAWHLDEGDEAWQSRCAQLHLAIERFPGPVIIVVEETGWGVVPPTAIGGLFRDRLGGLQQELMQHGTGAWLVVAGRALDLMRMGHAVPP
jgi:adenosylcobinamide kinase/adenosylcobinamide-phosphate guanylyltransferase